MLEALPPLVFSHHIRSLPPPLLKDLSDWLVLTNRKTSLELCFMRLDPLSLDLSFVLPLCSSLCLLAPLLALHTQVMSDFCTPLRQVLPLLERKGKASTNEEQDELESRKKEVLSFVENGLEGRCHPIGPVLPNASAKSQEFISFLQSDPLRPLLLSLGPPLASLFDSKIMRRPFPRDFRLSFWTRLLSEVSGPSSSSPSSPSPSSSSSNSPEGATHFLDGTEGEMGEVGSRVMELTAELMCDGLVELPGTWSLRVVGSLLRVYQNDDPSYKERLLYRLLSSNVLDPALLKDHSPDILSQAKRSKFFSVRPPL